MNAASPKRGLMIAAPRSGSGKTTLTLGLLRALRARGVARRRRQVRARLYRPRLPRRRGRARRRQSRFLGDGAGAGRAACAGGAGRANSSIVEASMGLFDGAPALARAHRRLGRRRRLARPAGAAGARRLRPGAIGGGGRQGLRDATIRACAIAGVVLNRVGSERHRAARRRRDRGARPAGAGRAAAPGRHRPARAPPRPRAGGGDAPISTRGSTRSPISSPPCRSRRGRWRSPRPARRRRSGGRRAAAAGPAHRDRARRALSPSSIRICSTAGAPPARRSCSSRRSPTSRRRRRRRLLAARRLSRTARRARSPRRARFLGGLRRFAETRPVHGECGGYMALGARADRRRRRRATRWRACCRSRPVSPSAA